MKSRIVAAIFGSFIISSIHGQTFESKLFVGPGSDYFTRYHWADFNADGAFDILEIDFYSRATLHLSDGEGEYSSTDISIEDLYFEEGVHAFNDYNGDGDIDMLARQGYSIVIVNYDKETNGFSLVNTGINFTDADYGKLYWLDLNGDLVLDIIFGRKIFINHEGVYSQSQLLPEYLSNSVFDDMNGDGLPDMVTGEYESYDGTNVSLFINEGDGHFNYTSPLTLPRTNLKSNTITLIDADGDSDIDVFALDNYARGWMFKNSLAQTGQLSFTAIQIFTNISMFKSVTADINSDGLPDIVGAGPTSLTVLRNTSTGTTIAFTPESYAVELQSFHNLNLVDINQDDKLDIHVKGHSSQNGTENLYFENIGTSVGATLLPPENLASIVEKNTTLSWSTVPELLYNIEIKRNGIIYKPSYTSPSGRFLLTTGNILQRSGSLILRGLPAGSYEWSVQTIDPSMRSSDFSGTNTFVINPGPTSLTLHASDLRRVELCWTYNGADSPSFSIFRGTSSGGAIEIAHVGAGVTCYEDSTIPENKEVKYFVVAVNGAIYSAPSNTVIHHSTLFVQSSFGMIDPNIIEARCLPGDYDMDGDYDLEFIGRIGSWDNNFLLKNNGFTSFVSQGSILSAEGIALPYTEMKGPLDIDNDGDLDLVLITVKEYSRKQVSVFVNQNGTFTVGFESPAYLEIPQLTVEDLNNDGRPDILFSHSIGNSSGNPNQYQLLYQTLDGDFEESNIIFTNTQTSSTDYFKCVDLNNDGFLDILWTSSDKSYTDILINDEGTSFTKKTSTLPSNFFMGVEDYTGDGNIDVITLGNEGLNLYFGTEDFTFTEPKVIPIEYLSGSPAFVNADIDLNGWTDLLLSDGYNSYVILNNGNGSLKSSDISLGKGWGASIAITDFENDGDIDLVKLGNDSQHQGLNNFYRNQLADINVVNEVPSSPEILSATYSAGKSTFTWSPSTDDHTPSALLTYNLRIVDVNGKTWLSSETNETGSFRRRLGAGNSGHSTNKTLNNLPAGNYTAQVQTIDASFAMSSWSGQIQLTIQEGPTALTVERLLLNKVKLSWNDAPFTETKVIVQRRSTQTNWEVIAELPMGSNAYTDANLEYNKLYQYRIFESAETLSTATSNIAEWSTNMWVLEDTEIPNLWGYMDVADFTGDGLMDMVLNGGMIYNGYTEDITRATFENTTSGWVKRDIAPSNLSHTAKIAFTDLNADSKLDIYQNGYSWEYGYKTETFLNNGDKTFSPTTNFLTDGTYSILSYFDYDMDNDLDLFVSITGTTTREILKNTGGNYNSIEVTTCSSCPYDVAVADFDQDGDEDIIRYASGNYNLYLNTPNGLIATNTSFPGYETRIFVQDYNSDGLPDIVQLTYSYYRSGKIFKNLGLQADGSLKFIELPVNLSRGEPSFLSADFDHDGQTDLAVISPNINVLLNQGDDNFEQYIEPGYNWGQHMANLIDFDNDGDLDIYVSGYHNNNYESTERKAKILLNQTIVASNGVMNTPPESPNRLSSTQDSSGVHLTWNTPIDDHTQPGGITYDVVLFRDGKSITKGDHDPATGKRLRLTPGRSTGILTLNNLSIGSYSWRVQAIDGSFAASDFSDEGTFVFLPPPPIMNDTLIYKCGRTITLTAQGNDIKWYRDEALTQLIASGVFHPEETQIVHVTQTIEGYQGIPKRVQITIEEKAPMPTLMQSNPLNICESSGLYTLWATGENIRWYSNASLTGLLSSNTTVQIPASNTTYFVTQTIDGCQSNALSVQVNMTTIDSRLYYSDDKIWTRETEGEFYSWYRNGSFFRYTNVPYINFDGEPATYVVSVRKGQCQEYSEPFILTPIEDQIESIFTVFPNPSSSYITLRSKHENVEINIFNSLGVLMYSTSLNREIDKTINTSSWTKGVYIISVDKGNFIYTKRLVLL